MSTKPFVSFLVCCLFLLLIAPSAMAQEPVQPFTADFDAPAVLSIGSHGNSYVHTVTPASVDGNATYLDHPLLNGNPNAIVFITPFWQTGLPLSNEFYGVYYETTAGQWQIFNLAGAGSTVAVGRKFIVQVHGPSESVFQVISPDVGGNISFPIDHPALNNNPFAFFHITQTFTVGGQITDALNNGSVRAHYFDGFWHIVNTDDSAFPEGVGYNVQVTTGLGRDLTFVHTATENTFGTFLNHPLLNLRPVSRLLVTPISMAYGVGAPDVQKAFIVAYNNDFERWIIGTEDLSVIPSGSQFVVTVLSTFQDSTNTIINDGFEAAQPNAIGKPAAWSTVGNVKRTCNRPSKGKTVSFEQYCAAQINGGKGSNSVLTQKITDLNDFVFGETIHFGARVQGTAVTKGVKAQVIIKFDNGTTSKLKIPASQLLGSYPYKPVNTELYLNTDTTNVTLKFSHRGSGKLFVDTVYVSSSELDFLLSAPLSTPEINTLPLPVAAD